MKKVTQIINLFQLLSSTVISSLVGFHIAYCKSWVEEWATEGLKPLSAFFSKSGLKYSIINFKSLTSENNLHMVFFTYVVVYFIIVFLIYIFVMPKMSTKNFYLLLIISSVLALSIVQFIVLITWNFGISNN